MDGFLCGITDAQVLQQARVLFEDLPRRPPDVFRDVEAGVAPSQCMKC